MSSYRTPIKYGKRNTIYIFLGDANIAMRIEMSLVQKPSWYKKDLWLACHTYDIQYASWDGHSNLLHVPSSNRTHSLISFDTLRNSYQNTSFQMVINGIDDFDTPDIPEFSPMAPFEVFRMARCPVPQQLDISWKRQDDISTLEMSLVSKEKGISIDAAEIKRKESKPSYIDEMYTMWGLENIT